MSVYNGEKYLKEAIDSILNQTLSDFEFIIIDDASKDKSEDIIKSYNDKRIIYITNKENIGQTKSLNLGLNIAKGKYIARQDADDISISSRFLRQVEFLEKNKNVGIVGSWWRIIDENGKVIKKYSPVQKYIAKFALICPLPVIWSQICHSSVLIKKEVLDNVGYYNEKYYIIQDYDLWIRISRKYEVVNLPEVLLSCRTHRNNITKEKFRNVICELEDIIASNIKYHLQDITPIEQKALLNMLMFRKQENSFCGEYVFEIFDKFYKSMMEDESKKFPKDTIKYSYLIKFLYLPRIFLTNKKIATKKFFEIFLRYPDIVFSKKNLNYITNGLVRSIKLKNLQKE